MKVIDPRSGTELKIGQPVDWGDGESITLIDVDPGLFSASAIVRLVELDWPTGRGPVLRTRTIETPLQVRWFHPKWFLEHVAFVPS